MSVGPTVSQSPKICGIYAIYSAINDKIYVGHSSNIKKRWYDHRSALRNRNKKKCNKHLLSAWILYGEEAFEFIVLEECSEEVLHIREQFHLDKHPNHYNHGPCAASPTRGVPLSDEHKAKLSAFRTGRKNTVEQNAKIKASMIGNTYSLGYTHTTEHRAKNSTAQMGNQNAAGHVQSDEARAKKRAAVIGIKRSEETRARMSAAQKIRRERERKQEQEQEQEQE